MTTPDGYAITITLCEVRNLGAVRIGFEAPPEVKIYREELMAKQGRAGCVRGMSANDA